MRDVVIAAVLDQDDGTLTMAVRINNRIQTPVQAEVSSPAAGAVRVLGLKTRYRLDEDLMVYIAASESASALRAEMDAAGSIGDTIVGLTTAPASYADGGQEFKDRWSELIYRMRANEALQLPEHDAMFQQLDAFARVPGEKIAFTDPLEVAKSSGEYPSLAVAVVLATIGLQASIPNAQTPQRPFNPYEALEERIRDRELRQARQGDGRYRSTYRRTGSFTGQYGYTDTTSESDDPFRNT